MSADFLASIVIPTYGRRDSVRRLLAAMACQTIPADQFEVVVSIDGAEDGTREMIADCSAPYALRGLWHPNFGRAGACNTALRLAQGDIVVILDDDMEPVSGFIAAHLAAHSGQKPRAVVGAVPVSIDSSLPLAAQYVGQKFNRHLAHLGEPGHVFKLRDFYTGNFSIRREVLSKVGLFDEDFKIYGSEDLELGVRLAEAGIEIVYDSLAVARQNCTKDLPALAKDHIAKGRTAVILALKHPSVWADSRLDTYHQGSRKWRLARAMLLGLSRRFGGTPVRVIQFFGWLEKALPAHYETCYNLLLDYCFWHGAQMEARERREAGDNRHGLTEARRDF
ncbi:MAG: glycosyltransferase family 2 protein [Chloroflexi bacterium]|nr:glycosyltransferase family 2 protein [Chloroflexota bacterium]